MSTAHVIRFFITHAVTVEGETFRKMMGARQGRNTSATEAEANARLAAILEANTEERLRSVGVEKSTLKVMGGRCYASNLDPVCEAWDWIEPSTLRGEIEAVPA
jgi:hypothetical protein